MPSRAVVRKKQRREARRRKAQQEAGAPSHCCSSAYLGSDESSPRCSSLPIQLPFSKPRAEVQVSRKRAPELSSTNPSSSPSTASPASASLALPPPRKRKRVEVSPTESMPEGLTRKERRRWETRQQLERQMSRLNSSAVAAKEMIVEAAAQHRDTASDFGNDDAAAASEPKLRHDPKFKNGTFWRDRKEKRARTLFLGGIPFSFSVKQVKDFISTVLDFDQGSSDYVDQIGKDAEVVDEVDMLPVKHHSKVKHMYVTMASVSLAGCAAALLDGYKVEGRVLRCNFAANKSEREEAIRRRTVAQR